MDPDILEKFKLNVAEIDSIFETSSILKQLYESSLKTINNEPSLKFTDKQKISNTLNALVQIEEESINEAESGAWERLFPQAMILVVSIAEQLLKDVFEFLLSTNLEKINTLDEKSIKFKELRDRAFNLDKDDYVELALNIVYGDENPEEKINFQNILKIKGTFKGYFGIDIVISDDLQKNLHYFYQCRHIIIHNAGIVDERFLKNLKKAQIQHSHRLGDKIIINSDKYDECKSSFSDFFKVLKNSLPK